MQTAYLTHPACLRHDPGPGHPDCPGRLRAVEDQLIASGIFPYLLHCEAPRATREQLSRVHRTVLLDRLEAASPGEGLVWIDPDTAMNPHSLEAARRAAGALVRATDLVVAGAAENAFCNVRPPGHHATRDRSMGFCFFNNVAVGVAHALEQHGLERVAVVDFDAHHGNGTEDIFRDDPRVMVCSSFQEGLYPESAADPANERMVFAPLPRGAGGTAFRAAFGERLLPALDRFRPRMIFVSAGFDGHREEDIAGLDLVEEDYAWVTRELKSLAAAHCGNRLVSVLEGGYEHHPLGRSATAHVRALCDL